MAGPWVCLFFDISSAKHRAAAARPFAPRQNHLVPDPVLPAKQTTPDFRNPDPTSLSGSIPGTTSKGNLTEKDSTATGSLLHWIYVYNDANEMTEARQYDASGMLSQTVD